MIGEWLLPSDWKWTHIEGIAASNKYSVVDGPFGSNLKTSDYVDDGIPVLQGKNITNNVFRWFDARFISEGKAEELKRSAVSIGDILIVKIGSIGYAAELDDLNGYPFAIIPANLAKLTIDDSKIDKGYLLHWLASPHVSRHFNSVASKTAQPALSLGKIKELPIPLPPLPEQKRIAAILDKADAIRRKRQQAIQLADELLSAQFLKKFGDPKDSPFGSKSLKDVALKITDGAHFTPTYVESGIPFLRVTDINGGGVDWSKVKYIPLEEHQELIKRCKPEKGDVLYSKNGTIGVPRLIDWDQEFSIFVSLCLIKPNPDYLRGRYLYSFLQTPFALKQATQKAKSATVTNLHLVEIKEIRLPVPSLAIQDEWIDFLDNFGCVKARLIESLNNSNDAFNSLSQKAFSGML